MRKALADDRDHVGMRKPPEDRPTTAGAPVVFHRGFFDIDLNFKYSRLFVNLQDF